MVKFRTVTCSSGDKDIDLFTKSHLILCNNYEPEPHHVTVIKTDGAGRGNRVLIRPLYERQIEGKTEET
jgi:hypothetical protein